MYEIEKEFKFEAAHQLAVHDGVCRRLHGHSWKGRVILLAPRLQSEGPKTGMLKDFVDVKAVLQPYVDDYLDHQYLNVTLPVYPTSENIAKWLYDELKPKLPELLAVEIEETCTSKARYYDHSDFKGY